jgi:hypothetical protein
MSSSRITKARIKVLMACTVRCVKLYNPKRVIPRLNLSKNLFQIHQTVLRSTKPFPDPPKFARSTEPTCHRLPIQPASQHFYQSPVCAFLGKCIHAVCGMKDTEMRMTQCSILTCFFCSVNLQEFLDVIRNHTFSIGTLQDQLKIWTLQTS